MKNKFFIIISFIAFNHLASAQQVPNGGFENWTNPSQPDGWYTFSSGGFVNFASKDLSSKVEGIASAKIQTGTISGQTTFEILSLGTANYVLSGGNAIYTYYPIYFPYRPDTLFFDYKYDSPGIDTASAFIKLSKGNNKLVEVELTLQKNTQWTNTYILLSNLYPNAEIPDSLLIQFKSSKTRNNFFGIVGSTLNVDKVRFGYKGSSSSIAESFEDFRFNVIPNPFQNQITFFLLDGQQTNLTIYDMLGHQILQQELRSTTTINTLKLTTGIYFYELKNADGILKSGKLIKQ